MQRPANVNAWTSKPEKQRPSIGLGRWVGKTCSIRNLIQQIVGQIEGVEREDTPGFAVSHRNIICLEPRVRLLEASRYFAQIAGAIDERSSISSDQVRYYKKHAHALSSIIAQGVRILNNLSDWDKPWYDRTGFKFSK